MVAPKRPRNTGGVKRRQRNASNTGSTTAATSTASSTSSSSSSYFMVLVVKLLLIIVILLWLPPLVTSKKRRNGKHDDSGRTMGQRLHRRRNDCEVDCMQWGHRQGVPPEESMNCIFHCMSSACFRQVYAELLEPGEVDIQRYELFEACAQEEIRQQRRQRAAERKND